jgi:signal transduction histidine kinase
MYFEVVTKDKEVGASQNFVQFRKKLYKKGNEQRIMLQIIDVSNQILYEQVYAENEFLAITNATVSHELRNPL